MSTIKFNEKAGAIRFKRFYTANYSFQELLEVQWFHELHRSGLNPMEVEGLNLAVAELAKLPKNYGISIPTQMKGLQAYVPPKKNEDT